METQGLTNDQRILAQFAEQIVIDMKREIPKVTGKTAASIEWYLTQTGFRIIGNQSVVSNIEGRGPTGLGYLKGKTTLQQAILEWIKAKGIVVDTVSQVSLSWAISKSIHKKGTLLYQRGGVNNFLESIWTDQRVNTFMEQFSGTLAERTMDYLTENFK